MTLEPTHTQIIVAFIALSGVVITVTANLYLAGRNDRKIKQVKKRQGNNDILEAQNSIMELVLPMLEKKDMTFDRVADTLELQDNRIRFIESDIEQLVQITKKLAAMFSEDIELRSKLKTICDALELEEKEGK